MGYLEADTEFGTTKLIEEPDYFDLIDWAEQSPDWLERLNEIEELPDAQAEAARRDLLHEVYEDWCLYHSVTGF